MSGCSRTVPGDASVPAPRWGIHDMTLEWWIFPSLGLSEKVWESLRYLYRGHAHRACLGAQYYSEDFFKQPHESCLHLGQNLPKFLVSKV